MKIAVFGASGKTGHELVKQALEQKHLVTAFVRNPSKLKITHDGFKVIQGDVINYQLVEEAVKGQDAVLSALGAASPFKYDRSVVDGVSSIIKAMEANGGGRFIYMSAINVKDSRKHAGLLVKLVAPTLLRTETIGHERREQIIRQSDLGWTMVRPATLTNGKKTMQIRSGEAVSLKGFRVAISRADVAYFMLLQLTDNTFLRKTPTIMY